MTYSLEIRAASLIGSFYKPMTATKLTSLSLTLGRSGVGWNGGYLEFSPVTINCFPCLISAF